MGGRMGREEGVDEVWERVRKMGKEKTAGEWVEELFGGRRGDRLFWWSGLDLAVVMVLLGVDVDLARQWLEVHGGIQGRELLLAPRGEAHWEGVWAQPVVEALATLRSASTWTSPSEADNPSFSPFSFDPTEDGGFVLLRAHQETSHGEDVASEALERQWDSMPSPSLRYAGAPMVLLDPDESGQPDGLISTMLFHSLAPSAKVHTPSASYAKRCNPSSGGLHPIEAMIMTGDAGDGFCGVSHYVADIHGLEMRKSMSSASVQRIMARLGRGESRMTIKAVVAVFGLPWREVWKYGPRGVRYTYLDAGHALHCIGLGGLVAGWDGVDIVVDFCREEVEGAFGVVSRGGEVLVPIGLVVFSEDGGGSEDGEDEEQVGEEEEEEEGWMGERIAVSASHNASELVDAMLGTLSTVMSTVMSTAGDTRMGETGMGERVMGERVMEVARHCGRQELGRQELGRLIRTRRSAHGFVPASNPEAEAHMTLATFTEMVSCALYTTPSSVDDACVSLIVYAPWVLGLEPGVYAVPVNAAAEHVMRDQVAEHCPWEEVTLPTADGETITMWTLVKATPKRVATAAKRAACSQNLARDAPCTFGMVALFPQGDRLDPAVYRVAHLEAGGIGNALYLCAEASGLSGTGIGCFLDSTIDSVFPRRDGRLRFVYFFVVGLEDPDTKYSMIETGFARPHTSATSVSDVVLDLT